MGSGRDLEVAGALTVGEGGVGTLAVTAGGQVSSKWGRLGSEPGSTGTATVTGSGSAWTNTANLSVGYLGAGTLRVEAGGQVSNVSGHLGYWSGSGTATVTGADSTWTNSHSLYVGYLGAGTMRVEAGGQVTSARGCLGVDVGSIGTVAVTGADSTWTTTGSLYVGGSDVGPGGTGTLTVQNGGAVTVGETLKLRKADSEVTVNAGTLTAGVLEGTTGIIGITDPAGGTALTVGSAASGTYAGALTDDTGPGSLTKIGAGTQTLAGAGIAYTGTTTVLDGILKLSDTMAFASAITNDADVEFEATTGTWTFGSALAGGGTFVKSGDGTLIISGPQDYDAGALFEVLAGTVEMHTDASSTGDMADASLSMLVADAQLDFGCDQHLDTLTIDDGGLVRLTGANVVVVKNLVMNGIPLGPMTLTPEPATLALLAVGALGVLFRRRRA